MTLPDPDPDVQILRDAEARRGGCGAFVVAVTAMLLVGTIHAIIFVKFYDRMGPYQVGAALLAGLIASLAAGIWAARQFTRLRIRLTGKRPPGA